jgi:hypothetical protein
MSISVLYEPPIFQPVLTNGLFFTVSADTTNNYRFRYTYDLYVNGVNVFQGKATPNPYGLGVVDVSRILQTYCSNMPISVWNTTDIYTHQTFPFSRPYTDETINYQVKFGYEYSSTELGSVTGFTGSGNTEGAPSIPSTLLKTFQSTMGVNGRATQQNFDINPFVLSGDPTTTNPTTSGLFLTNSPRTRDLEEDEFYTLAFTNWYLSDNTISQPYYVEYKFYDDFGTLITGVTIDNVLTNGGGPLPNCSYVYQSYTGLLSTGDTTYNTLYVGAGPRNLQNIIPPNTAQYTVQLFGNFTGTTSPVQPTPTPTPTPSSTPLSCPCLTYEVFNPSLEAQGVFNFIDCSGISQLLVVDPQETFFVCVCSSTSWSVQGPLIVTYDSPCTIPSPTPTPTPSSTPCECVEYEVDTTDAETEAPVLLYTFCDGTPIAYTMSVPQIYQICGCSGTFTCGDAGVSITLMGPC